MIKCGREKMLIRMKCLLTQHEMLMQRNATAKILFISIWIDVYVLDWLSTYRLQLIFRIDFWKFALYIRFLGCWGFRFLLHSHEFHAQKVHALNKTDSRYNCLLFSTMSFRTFQNKFRNRLARVRYRDMMVC